MECGWPIYNQVGCGTRQAVYDDVLARTGNEAEAAFQAMEIINFSRRGSNPYVKLVTATIPFLNARFQGLDVFMRSLGGDYSAVREEQKSKIQLRLAIRASTMVGFTALYYALASGNDWYEEQDEEVRELNWLIPLRGVPFRFIPFEVGLLLKRSLKQFSPTMQTGNLIETRKPYSVVWYQR